MGSGSGMKFTWLYFRHVGKFVFISRMNPFLRGRGILIYLMLFVCSFQAQSQVKLMTYNLLNYPGNDTIVRNPYFRTIIKSVEPDILVVQEITSQAAVDGFLQSVLNADDTLYSSGLFIDGYDSDNAVFYKKEKFNFLGHTPILTDLRNISEFILEHIVSGLRLHIFSVHLRSSSGQVNENLRGYEIDSLRKYTDHLPAGTEFLVCGDFNIYHSGEPAYMKLDDNSSGDGYFIDPLTMPGVWNDSAYAPYHTQSPRIRLFGGGSGGGLDDRFDMILHAQSIVDSGGIKYIPGSLTAYGNDGKHYQDSINHLPNSSVSAVIADAIANASDHLPVFASYLFGNPDFSIVFLSFVTSLNGNMVDLKWKTAAESNLKGYHIERRLKNKPWQTIGFVNGHGTTSLTHEYNFQDKSLVVSGIYFYRLKMEDYNGFFYYSEIHEVNFFKYLNENSIEIWPNPFSGETTITVKDYYEGELFYSIMDLTGQTINKDLPVDLINSRFQIAPGKLAKGFYILRLTDKKTYVTKKLIRH